jgi:hypothetical protein
VGIFTDSRPFFLLVAAGSPSTRCAALEAVFQIFTLKALTILAKRVKIAVFSESGFRLRRGICAPSLLKRPAIAVSGKVTSPATFIRCGALRGSQDGRFYI